VSEFKVEVVRVGLVTEHPNADALEIVHVFDYPVCTRLGDYREGDLAVYVPIDAIVPGDDPRWHFLAGHLRIRAKRLRGVFSMGLLTTADPSWVEGQDVREALRIEKWEPPTEFERRGHKSGPSMPDPGHMPKYTDLEGVRRQSRLMQYGEEVVLTEKIHGANARYVFADGQLWCASRTQYKIDFPTDQWWQVARRYDLATKLASMPGIAIYGEVYGAVQDLRYGADPGEVRLILFDAWNTATARWLNYDDFGGVVNVLGLPTVPVVYRGPWSDELRSLANGPSTMPGAPHMREGFVVRPVRERWDPHVGRVILKLVGEDYLLRKAA
jgi:RNA ligase (TIGR02306 family)